MEQSEHKLYGRIDLEPLYMVRDLLQQTLKTFNDPRRFVSLLLKQNETAGGIDPPKPINI